MAAKQRASRNYRGGSLRLPGYDYTEAGAYAVTIRTQGGQVLFGEVVDGMMHLNAYGRVAQACCEEIPLHFGHARLDTCVIMPNHLHAIIVLSRQSQRCAGQTGVIVEQFGRPVRGSLPTIIRSLKSAVSRRVNLMRNEPGASLWQRGYYEHVIRHEVELNEYREYIIHNPLRWSLRREE